MTCLECGAPSSRSAVIRGQYYPELCAACYARLVAGQSPSSGAASYNRQRDLEDHLADVAQPYVGGKPNPDFIQLYPDRAREMWGDDKMRDRLRNDSSNL